MRIIIRVPELRYEPSAQVKRRAARSGSSIMRRVLALLASLIALIFACDRSPEDARVRQLLEFENEIYEGQQPSDERLEELREAVREYESRVVERVRDHEHLGRYHKMLAIEYINREMYGPALQELQAAIEIQTENPVLFYYAAIAAARQAKSTREPGQRLDLYEAAEWYYRRAVELRPQYRSALYGLAVLYLFELEAPDEAEPYLARLLEVSPSSREAQFLEARMRVMQGRLEEAIGIYDTIASEARDAADRETALRNKRELQGAMR